uniref:Myotubularin phosphatase domain-containing protein n=1 Tax=Glossina brevipalpis TaxID=37001 RepID=A0A1A9X134_9MUSC
MKANLSIGKSYEIEEENIKFHFLRIENIRVQRTRLQKLVEACEQKTSMMSDFLNAQESSEWLKHARSSLDTSNCGKHSNPAENLLLFESFFYIIIEMLLLLWYVKCMLREV